MDPQHVDLSDRDGPCGQYRNDHAETPSIFLCVSWLSGDSLPQFQIDKCKHSAVSTPLHRSAARRHRVRRLSCAVDRRSIAAIPSGPTVLTRPSKRLIKQSNRQSCWRTLPLVFVAVGPCWTMTVVPGANHYWIEAKSVSVHQ
jgi:hypothetical protein